MDKVLLLILALMLALSACDKSNKTIVIGGSSMGTSWSLKADLSPTDVDAEQLQLIVQARLDEIDAAMSTWRDSSEVSIFNQAGVGCSAISSPTKTVLEAALIISDLSDGAFDITVSPLVRLWGFGRDFTGDQIPPEAEILRLQSSVGYQKLRLGDTVLCKSVAGLSINLSALAKGFAVDQVALILAQLGIANFLMEVGGELYASGQNPQGRTWAIGVEQPITDGRGIVEKIAIPLHNQGVATSGDYRNYFEKGGVRYSHIIDPVTAYPVIQSVGSVTVIAKSAMLADAWATTLLVLGLEKGMALANKEDLKVLMLVYAGAEFIPYTSEAWDL